MARWSEVRGHVVKRFRAEILDENQVQLTWSWRDGRTQGVSAVLRRAFDRKILHIRSAFAREDEVAVGDVLRLNRELPFATIALDDGTYYVVYNALLRHLSLDEVEFCLARVAAVADTLEEQFLQRDVH